MTIINTVFEGNKYQSREETWGVSKTIEFICKVQLFTFEHTHTNLSRQNTSSLAIKKKEIKTITKHAVHNRKFFIFSVK